MDLMIDRGSVPLTVVAVDDNPADLELLRQALGGIENPPMDVVPFHNPAEAAAALAARDPDVLLLDFNMGSCTGIEFLERVRGLGVRAPAILLTGAGDEELVVRAMHAGFSDYISKAALSTRSLHRSILNVTERHRLTVRANSYRSMLEATVCELEGKNREISSFYHTLAHELKTPLTGAREFVSIVVDGLQGPINEDQRDLLSSAVRSCDQLRRCIDDLFDVSRIETGKLEVAQAPAQLDEIVKRGLACFGPEAEALGIELVPEITDGLPPIDLDEQRILQVISNLVGNALKFSDRGGRIVVSCRSGPGAVQSVSVSDTGCGIEPVDLDQIFERLYQAKGNATVRGGMGLGLHLCRELVRLHGGEIQASSEIGKGSTFEFVIPTDACVA